MTIRIDGTNTTANPGITGGDADTGLQFGTDEVKIVTGGSERALVDSSGYLRLAGAGIQFNGDTAAANALDDYEEGTWSPGLVTGTATFNQPLYTKIGRFVIAWAWCSSFSDRSLSADVLITNLPFAPTTSQAGGSSFMRYTDNIAPTIYARNDGRIGFYGVTSGAYDTLKHNDLNNANAEIYFFATYQVD